MNRELQDSPYQSFQLGPGMPFSSDSSHPWFAVRVKHQFEAPVASHLGNSGYETLLPLYRARRKWSDRIKIVEAPLFPGYVFCAFDPRDRIPIDIIPGVTAIVGFGSKLAEIDRGEIAAIRAALGSGLPSAPWPRLEPGCKVEIDFGPLSGLQGVVVRDVVQNSGSVREKLSLILSVSLLNRSLAVEINREWIRAVS